MKRYLVCALLLLLTGCGGNLWDDPRNGEMDRITLYGPYGQVVGHYRARYADWHTDHEGRQIWLTTVEGQTVVWSGLFLVETEPLPTGTATR